MSTKKQSKSSRIRERAILDFITELLSFDKLEDILQAVMQQTPKLINSRGCSIFLVPDLVKQYKGKLINDDGKVLKANQVHEDFIVLAAASKSRDLSSRIGKYFYRAGEGLTGWVFANKRPVLLDDMTDEEELQRYDGLRWKNKYKGAHHYYNMRNKSPKPYLAVPLVLGDKCYGVVRIGTSQNRKPFPTWAKELFLSLGKIISHRIELETASQKHKTSIRKQKISIENLIKIGSLNISRKQESFSAILEEAQKILGASTCCLYLPDMYGETVKLEAATTLDERGRRRSVAPLQHTYRRGEGLTGWVFNTGKPLLINDIASFSQRRRLTNRELDKYSDSHCINAGDREISALNQEVLINGDKFTHFAVVPLLTAGDTQGVLLAMSRANEKPFTRRDLSLLKDIAAHISMMLENLKQQKLTEMLIGIGQRQGDDLFRYVVENMPELVLARGCSIFRKSKEGDYFQLKYTNREELMEDAVRKQVRQIRYKPGDGKTGLVAQLGRCLVINHYGTGALDQQKLNKDFNKYSKAEEYRTTNLVGLLKDLNSEGVGLARLVKTRYEERDFTQEDKRVFKRFVGSTVFNEDGLSSSEPNKLCEEGGDGFTKSFLACPLHDVQGNVFGVLRMPRTFPGGTFTDEALALTISVCNRLSAILEKEKVLEQNQRILEQNLRTLSEITSKINTSFGGENPEDLLDDILDAVITALDFEFASIQKVNRDDNTIYTERGLANKKIKGAMDPNQWMDRARHPLDPPDGEKRDIHAWLLRERKKEIIIKGWHENFDWEIYERFGHKDLVRAFIPIIARRPDSSREDEMIGTLEAGHNINRKSDIDDREMMMLIALAGQAAIAIKNRNLHDELIKADLLKLVPFMSHILKDPANILYTQIKAMMEELSRSEPDLNWVKELAEDLNRTALSILTMSSTLAEVVRGREDLRKIEEVNEVALISALNAVKNMLVSPHDGESVEIKVISDLPESHVPLSGIEEKWLQVIFLNLLLNAKKYSPPNGVIEVLCEREPENGGIVISVNDQGPGVPEDIRPHLFKKCVHSIADGWPEGSGLGLFTVNDLANKLGWTCCLANNSQNGARFEVHIPKGWRGHS